MPILNTRDGLLTVDAGSLHTDDAAVLHIPNFADAAISVLSRERGEGVQVLEIRRALRCCSGCRHNLSISGRPDLSDASDYGLFLNGANLITTARCRMQRGWESLC
jgi:hypothetical protein